MCVYLFQTPARIADLYPVNACVRALSKTGPSVLRSDHQRITTPRILATERSCDRSIKRPKGPSPTCATSSPIKWRPITFLNKRRRIRRSTPPIDPRSETWSARGRPGSATERFLGDVNESVRACLLPLTGKRPCDGDGECLFRSDSLAWSTTLQFARSFRCISHNGLKPVFKCRFLQPAISEMLLVLFFLRHLDVNDDKRSHGGRTAVCVFTAQTPGMTEREITVCGENQCEVSTASNKKNSLLLF